MNFGKSLRCRQSLAAVVFFCWVLFSSTALFVFGNQDYGEFDKYGQWQFAAAALSIDSLGLKAQNGFQVVHVRQQGCSCNRRADEFKAVLAREHDIKNSAQYDIEIRQLNMHGITVPATPAVLIFHDGALVYAGPYASGPLCSVNDSIITPILQQQITLPGVWFNGEAKSCRCINVV